MGLEKAEPAPQMWPKCDANTESRRAPVLITTERFHCFAQCPLLTQTAPALFFDVFLLEGIITVGCNTVVYEKNVVSCNKRLKENLYLENT